MSKSFSGFPHPRSNFSKLPHDIINQLPQIETLGEMKVILYILRHTWGFQEFGTDESKKITLDEFQNGRKMRNGERFDTGTGMSKPTIVDGLKRAETHGFIVVETDDRDAARVKRFYRLRMAGESAVKKPDSSGKESLPPGQESGKETLPRTEKDTFKKDTPERKPASPSTRIM